MLFVAAVVGQLYEHLLPWSVSDTYWYIWLNNSLAWIHDTATCYFLHSFLRYLTRGPVLNGAVSGAVGHVREPEHDHCSARQPRLSLGLVKLWPGCFHKPWQVCQAVEMSLPSVAVRPGVNYGWTPNPFAFGTISCQLLSCACCWWVTVALRMVTIYITLPPDWTCGRGTSMQ